MLLLALPFKAAAQGAAVLALRPMRGPAGLLPLVLLAAGREEPRTLQIIITLAERVAHRATSQAARQAQQAAHSTARPEQQAPARVRAPAVAVALQARQEQVRPRVQEMAAMAELPVVVVVVEVLASTQSPTAATAAQVVAAKSGSSPMQNIRGVQHG